jgi:hypothetical protein
MGHVNSRVEMMRRFKYWEWRGKKCVLLIFVDHDPGGLLIAEFLRKNLADLSHAVDWSPAKLIIDRFGLKPDFIRRHRLTWIDNLETIRRTARRSRTQRSQQGLRPKLYQEIRRSEGRKKWVSFVLKDRQYNKKTPYRLVLQDADTGIEQQSVDVIIDRAFTDDF